MYLVDRITSLATLLSLFLLTPMLGRAFVLWREKGKPGSVFSQQIMTAQGTAIAIVVLTTFYGVIWEVHPKSIIWYGWINRDIPIVGDVEVTGSVEISNDPVNVHVAP